MPGRFDYLRDPDAIYRCSFEIVADEVDLDRFAADQRALVSRIVHACGMPDVAQDLKISGELVQKASAALAAGVPILCDCEMVAAAITRRLLPAQNQIIVTLNEPSVPSLAKARCTTRSAAAVNLWTPALKGAVVAIGNAPTALFALLEGLLDGDFPPPAAIIAFPVGFVGAAEAKAALAEADLDCPFVTLPGRRGGSALAAAAVNALAIGARAPHQ